MIDFEDMTDAACGVRCEMQDIYTLKAPQLKRILAWMIITHNNFDPCPVFDIEERNCTDCGKLHYNDVDGKKEIYIQLHVNRCTTTYRAIDALNSEESELICFILTLYYSMMIASIKNVLFDY